MPLSIIAYNDNRDLSYSLVGNMGNDTNVPYVQHSYNHVVILPYEACLGFFPKDSLAILGPTFKVSVILEELLTNAVTK